MQRKLWSDVWMPKTGMKCSAVCFHCSGETCSNVMELSELINENDFDDEPPTLTPLPSPVLPLIGSIGSKSRAGPNPESKAGPESRSRPGLNREQGRDRNQERDRNPDLNQDRVEIESRAKIGIESGFGMGIMAYFMID
ncbi:hypothetical protein EVAR_67891_1 [Eumeta japonica]|uniref:Uncharacterized protein n=1 Tax=Eumeta variegata TaxID=151549 RepID=A0A4C1YSG7_EUMVA|nr:hypothetical protein EVAR_67891_1 [Eumeta japonica]